MIRPKHYLYWAIGIVVILLMACGGGDKALEEALQAVTENDLAIMVLPQEELGDEFASLELDVEESGFQDNAEAAEDSIDPNDTAADLEAAGRTNGYELSYSDPDLFSALEAGEGVAFAGTSVQLFRDGPAASDFLAKQVADFQRFEGKEIEAGIALKEVETFAVSGLADEATGLRARITFGEAQFYGTIVSLRLERLVGSAFVARTDDANVNAQVEEIARALEERIKGVLLGDIKATPVPLPQVEEEEGAPPPEGEPDLAAMALSLDDLPAGVSIDHEGYVADEDTVASYEREFDLGLVRIGSSQLVGLESDIDLYEDATEASLVFSGIESVFTSESAPEFFASTFREEAGFEPTNLRIEPVALALGDDSAAVRATFDTPLGPFESIFIFIRVDRVLGSLLVQGEGGKVNQADVKPLAAAMAQRMAAGLGAQP